MVVYIVLINIWLLYICIYVTLVYGLWSVVFIYSVVPEKKTSGQQHFRHIYAYDKEWNTNTINKYWWWKNSVLFNWYRYKGKKFETSFNKCKFTGIYSYCSESYLC